jgi:hypothetical protein
VVGTRRREKKRTNFDSRATVKVHLEKRYGKERSGEERRGKYYV